VKLFDLEGGGLEYVRSLDKQEGRVLAVAWHADDEVIVAGGADSTIRVLTAATGRTRMRITLGSTSDTPTLVWSVCVLKDMTIVSGDSRGHTEFWNGTYGTLEESFNQHEADVLTLVTNEAEDTVYASGVDNKLVQIKRLRSDAKRRWVMSGRARDHTHDVRSIALGPNGELVTGGVDTNLIVYSEVNFGEAGSSHRKIPPFPQQQFISLARQAEVLLHQHPRKLQLWKLGSVGQASDDHTVEGSEKSSPTLGIDQQPALLLELTPFSLDNITCSATTSDANFVAYSCVSGTRVFTINSQADGSVQVARMKRLPRDLLSAQTMTFTPDNSQLVLVSLDRKLQVLDLESQTLVTSEITANDGVSDLPGVSLLSVSSDGSKAAISHDLAIRVFDVETCEVLATLPRLESQHTAMAFAPDGNVLVIVCVNNKIYMYDTEDRDFTDWSKQNSDVLPHQWLRRKEKVVGISFSPTLPNTLVLQDHSSMCVLHTDQPLPNRNIDLGRAIAHTGESQSTASFARGSRGSKRKPSVAAGTEPVEDEDEDGEGGDGTKNFKLIRRFQPLLFADFSETGAMVVVERPWLAVMQTFPPPLYRSKYGS
jgi:U3 small nucleolar RNA-associated protein 4